MAKKPNKRRIKVYPCIVYELTDQNIGWDEGFRFRVNDIDGDKWYFRDKSRMFDLLSIHAMHPVTEQRMDELRQKRATKKN